MCSNNIQSSSRHDHVAASHPLRLKRKLSIKSSGNMLIPCALYQLPRHGYLFFGWGEGALKGSGKGLVVVVVVEGWRSVVTLHVPVCACLHLWLSSHLTGLSVSTADHNASLSLTGWTDSVAIQTDSSSGSWWRDGGLEGKKGEGWIWGWEARPLRSDSQQREYIKVNRQPESIYWASVLYLIS